MNSENHWFKKVEHRFRPVPIHWMGHALEMITVALSAVFAAAFVLRLVEPLNVTESLPFFAFASFAMAQGTKYYFYHEKTLH